MTELAPMPAVPATSPAAEVVSFVQMIERVARDASIDIDRLDRLLVMRERENARQAEQGWKAAMSAAQAEMEPVRADATNDQTRSRYASHAALDGAIRAIYTGHGFGLTFDSGDAPLPEHVRIICDVSHPDGHSRRYHLDMPVDGKGAKGGDVMTKTHAMGSGITYGKRYLLGMIFNLAVSKDDDGNAAGGQKLPARIQRNLDRLQPKPGDIAAPSETRKTLPKKDARDIFAKIQDEIHKATSVDGLRAWGEANAERIAVLPEDWQDILRLKYSERIVDLRQFPPKAVPECHAEGVVIWEGDHVRPATEADLPPVVSHREMLKASMEPLDHTDHGGIPGFCRRKSQEEASYLDLVK